MGFTLACSHLKTKTCSLPPPREDKRCNLNTNQTKLRTFITWLPSLSMHIQIHVAILIPCTFDLLMINSHAFEKNVCMNWTLNVESSKEPPKHNKANFTWIVKLFIALNQPYLEMVHVGFIIAYTKNWTKVHVWQWSTTLTILNLEFHKTFFINKLTFPFP
jgi:hypothetical protein